MQIVIAYISPAEKQYHIHKLQSIVRPLFGFIYSTSILSNEVCTAKDVPTYFTETQ